MEKPETETKGQTPEDGGSILNRNRSFKSKQLVRSQAIRESHSPPRTVSPHPAGDTVSPELSPRGKLSPDAKCEEARQSVEIQITTGAYDGTEDVRPNRTDRCPSRTDCTNLLSNSPRVACVCMQCAKCSRGKRREHRCPIKQDSGISCSDDCPDCTDTDTPVASQNNECLMKSPSASAELDIEHVCRCTDKPKNNLSRNDSDDRLELNGVDLVNFIKATLNKNPKDRMALLKIEKELHSLVTDTGRCVVRFPVMTSYGRMLVHRCATLFQLSHNLDSTSKTQVVVTKYGTSGGTLPCTSFKSWCTVNFPNDYCRQHEDSVQAKSILKRSAHSLDETSGSASGAAGRSKSLEQREKEYERVRRRIFSSDNCNQDEGQWPWLSGPVKLLTPESGRNRLLKVQSLETASVSAGPSRKDRGAVSKSHSFGSYGGEDVPTPRLLSRQGDLASSSWRLSPSSSGYKTLSLRSTDSVTPSPTGGVSPEPPLPTPVEGGALVWAVTDLTAVPPGALIIHPQTGRPLTNPDGSLYQYDPANPPAIYETQKENSHSKKVDQNNEKRRGRLEKQHSFMDNDCEATEEYRKNCCCDYQKQQVCCQAKVLEKVIPDKIELKQSAPPSPSKHRFEGPTNQEPHNEPPANQKASLVSTNPISAFKPQTVPYEVQTNRNVEQVYETIEQPIRTQCYEAPANQIMGYEAATNRSPPFEIATNRSPPFEQPTNRSTPFESRTNRSPPYDAANNVRSQQFYQSNQRTPLANQQEADNKNMDHGAHAGEAQRTELDTLSPPQQVMTLQQNALQTHDPNAGHIPLAVYPAQLRSPYQDYSQLNQYQQQLYQQVVTVDDQKTVQLQDNSFRIDPSYPYAGVETYAACPAQCNSVCADPNAVLNHHHRSVGVYAPQMEAAHQVYPVTNVLLPHQYSIPQYQQLQWQPNIPLAPIQQILPFPPPLQQKPPSPPVYISQDVPLYPMGYQYPLYQCYPVYSVQERSDRRTDGQRAEAVTERKFERRDSSKSESTLSRQNSNELAMKIQQIKEHMASLNTNERERDRREAKGRRNNGNGILGSYPANSGVQNRTGRPPINDESQLTNAAKAIVNSIRSMQGKQHYQNENPRRNQDYSNQSQNHSQNQNQHQNRENRTEHRTDRTEHQRTEHQRNDYQRNYHRNNSFENRNRYQRYPQRSEDDHADSSKSNCEQRTRVEQALCRSRPPINVVRQINPGNWFRRSPAPSFTPGSAFRSRHPPPDSKPRRQ